MSQSEPTKVKPPRLHELTGCYMNNPVVRIWKLMSQGYNGLMYLIQFLLASATSSLLVLFSSNVSLPMIRGILGALALKLIIIVDI